MGLLDFLSGGSNGAAPDLYAGALTPEQQAAMRQQALAGAMGGLLKSGALDYTVPFISGKVPGGFAAGLAGAAAGAQDATNNAANIGMKAQEFLLNRTALQQKLALLGKYAALASGQGGNDGVDAFGPSGGATPPEMGGQAWPQATPEMSGQDGMPLGMSAVAKGGFNIPQLYDLAVKGGFKPGQEAATQAAIMMAESGGSPNAHNTKGEDSVSLNQINRDAWGPNVPTDPLGNTRFAHDVVFPQQGWGAWSVYKNGSYKQFMPAALAAAASYSGSGNAAPVRVAQNGPLTSLPARTGLSGYGPNAQLIDQDTGRPLDLSGPAPAAPAGPIPMNHLGASGPMSTPAPQIADNTNAPPPPPAAMPQGLLPPTAAAPPVNPVMQPPDAPPQAPPLAGAAPAAPAQQMPPIPSGGTLTPGQFAYAKRQQALSMMGSLLGIKNPAYVDRAAGLPFVGPEEDAKSYAAAKYKFNTIRPGSAGGYPGGPMVTQPSFQPNAGGYTAPGQPFMPVPGYPQGVGTVKQAGAYGEGVGKNAADAQPQQIGASAGPQDQPGAQGETSAIPGTPLAPGLSSKQPVYKEPEYLPSQIEKRSPEWGKTEGELVQAASDAQTAESRMMATAKAFQLMRTGEFTTDKADWNAAILGMFGARTPDDLPAAARVLLTAKDPAQAEVAIHNQYVANLNILKSANNRFTQRELLGLQSNSANPDLRPEANLSMLAHDIATARYVRALASDWTRQRVTPGSGHYNPDIYRSMWQDANPYEDVVNSVAKEIGVGELAPVPPQPKGAGLGGVTRNGIRWSIPQ